MSFSLSEITIPVWIFLIFFGLYFLFYATYSLFNVFHLVKYGVAGSGLFSIVIVFLGGTILLTAGSVYLLLPYDWTYALPLNQFTDLFQETTIL